MFNLLIGSNYIHFWYFVDDEIFCIVSVCVKNNFRLDNVINNTEMKEKNI